MKRIAHIDGFVLALLQEEVLELEYLERQPAPAPQDSLQHDDWVSCLHAQGDW
jgi:hypothetical protein